MITEKKLKIANQIIESVNTYYELNCKKYTRLRVYVDARRLAYVMMRELNFSYSDIARIFGKNHASIVHSVKKYYDLIQTEPAILEDEEEVKKIYELSKHNPYAFMSRFQLIKTIESLKSSLDLLSLQQRTENDSIVESG